MLDRLLATQCSSTKRSRSYTHIKYVCTHSRMNYMRAHWSSTGCDGLVCAIWELRRERASVLHIKTRWLRQQTETTTTMPTMTLHNRTQNMNASLLCVCGDVCTIRCEAPFWFIKCKLCQFHIRDMFTCTHHIHSYTENRASMWHSWDCLCSAFVWPWLAFRSWWWMPPRFRLRT